MTASHAVQPQLLIYGGSFDPFHKGHLALVLGLLRRYPSGWVAILPAARSPFKNGTRLFQPPSQPLLHRPLPGSLRTAMISQTLTAHAPNARWLLLNLELRRAAPSWSSITAFQLSTYAPRARLTWVLGSDAFANFARWHRARYLLHHGDLLIIRRRLPAPQKASAAEERLPEQGVTEESTAAAQVWPAAGAPPSEHWRTLLPKPWDQQSLWKPTTEDAPPALPVSETPVSDTPLRDIPPGATPLHETSLHDIPFRDLGAFHDPKGGRLLARFVDAALPPVSSSALWQHLHDDPPRLQAMPNEARKLLERYLAASQQTLKPPA